MNFRSLILWVIFSNAKRIVMCRRLQKGYTYDILEK